MFLAPGAWPALAVLVLVLASSLPPAAAHLRSPARPHILLVVADDLGSNDVGFRQNKAWAGNPRGLPTASAASGLFATPNLDQLVREGVSLSSHYTQPLCSPTRAALLTGRLSIHQRIGPDVIEISDPYGLPAAETLLPALLKRKANYSTHAIGKWHLGACHAGYLPTSRGFDTFAGYLAGAQSYYHHAADFRIGGCGSSANCTPPCAGAAVDNVYSTLLDLTELERVVHAYVATHGSAAPSSSSSSSSSPLPPSSLPPGPPPLFIYLALQTPHNPYEVPPASLVGNVNETFAAIASYERRVYAGMVSAMDQALGNATALLRSAGLWNDTLTVLLSDNGGIEFGNNFPLRGAKVTNWEGGIRNVAVVRGTDNPALLPLPRGGERSQLIHVSDWLPTLAAAAGIDLELTDTLPLDGVNQLPVLRSASAAAIRTSIVHNLPTKAHPVPVPGAGGAGAGPAYSTSTCMEQVLNTTGPCHGFGLTGGALRVGDLKLLVTFPGEHPWGDSSPAGTAQFVPDGFDARAAGWNLSVPVPYNQSLYLFNITADPTETVNLAASQPAALAALLAQYQALATAASTRPALSWRWAFTDPQSSRQPDHCMGPFPDSLFCTYGLEDGCFVQRRRWSGGRDLAPPAAAADPFACQRRCRAVAGAAWFLLDAGQAATAAAPLCRCLAAQGAPLLESAGSFFGPVLCPGDA